MIQYDIAADSKDINEAVSLFEFIGGNTSDAVRIAINRAAPKVRTKASKAIRSQVRLKASYVNGKLRIVKASRARLSGAIRADSQGLLLSKFSTDTKVTNPKVSWLKPPPMPARGIKVKVKPDGSPKPLGGDYFYMVLPMSRALAIVKRRSKPGPKGGMIDVAYGPSVSQVFNDVRQDVLPDAQQDYQDELIRAMSYILRKKHPKE